MSPMIASAVTVLPDPDSPTSATRLAGVDRERHAVDARAAHRRPRPNATAQVRRPRASAHTRAGGRGSSAARRPSPTKLTASTVRKIARPGNTVSHHVVLDRADRVRRAGCPSSAWAAGCRTRGTTACVSTRIASATTSVAFTMIGPAQFGTTWRTMIRVFDAPIARAASTNSRSRSCERRAAHDTGDRAPQQERQQQRDPERAAEVERAERAEVDDADRHRDREERQRRQRDPQVGEAHEQARRASRGGSRPARRSPRRSRSRAARRRARSFSDDLPAVQHPRQGVAARARRCRTSAPTTALDVGCARCSSVGLGAKRTTTKQASDHEHQEPEPDHRRHVVPEPPPARVATRPVRAGVDELVRRERGIERLGPCVRADSSPTRMLTRHLRRSVADAPVAGAAAAVDVVAGPTPGCAGRARRRARRRRGCRARRTTTATAIHASSTGIVGPFERVEEQQPEPRPLKMRSTTTTPPSSTPASIATTVTNGISELRSAWRRTICDRGTPLARAVRT